MDNQQTDLLQESLITSETAVIGVTSDKLLHKPDLVEPHDIQSVMKDIHNHLAANASNMTRSETLSQQLINLLFCKLFDELNTPSGEPLILQRYPGESPQELKKRLQSIFEKQIKTKNPDLFSTNDQIDLDSDSLSYVVKQLQGYRIADAGRDLIGDAFEAILGDSLKGSKGQFFTPRNAIQMMVDIVDPQPGERILDPACGSGGFLTSTLRHLQNQVSESSDEHSESEFVGVDKDAYLARVANIYMRLLGAHNAYIFNENSLSHPSDWKAESWEQLQFGSFDVILTNPPFGQKLKVKDKEILSQFDLAYSWRSNGPQNSFARTDRITHTPPQILFIERCIDFLRDGGRLGIVLPESLFGNPSYEYIMHYLQERVQFRAVVSMPEELFQPYTHAKSCILIAQKTAQVRAHKFFMGIADWCGHDSRGNPTLREDPQTGKAKLLDDIPEITRRYGDLMRQEKNGSQTHLGFLIKQSEIVDNTFVPKYYDPEITQVLENLAETHDLISIGSLAEQKILSVKTGVEVGRLAYGTGPIPFIRTSDISNWEIKIDPKHCVSEEIFEKYRKRAEVRPEDILLVRDGTYLVGTSCILTKYDTRILFQSHLYRLRVLKSNELDPFLLFAALNSPIVKRQIRAKQFTQHIIDTLGSRIYELVLPIPKSPKEKNRLATRARDIVETRARLRQEAKEVAEAIEGNIETFESEADMM